MPFTTLSLTRERRLCRILVYATFLMTSALASCLRADIVFDESSFVSRGAEIEPLSDPIHITFPSSAGTASMSLSATKKWTVGPVGSRSAWCSVLPGSGDKGTSKITVTVPENEGYDERSATFIFTCDIITRTIIVTQKQKDAVLLSPSRLEVPPEGGSFDIEVQHNVEYSAAVEGDAPWITILGTKGLSNGRIRLQVAVNDDLAVRHGRVVVRSSAGTEAIDVYQAGGAPAILLSQNEYTVPSDGVVITVEVSSNIDYNYGIVEGSEWISEATTKSMSSHTLHFNITKNESHDGRTGRIRFSDAKYGLTEDVVIVQQQKDALLLSQEVFTVSSGGELITVDILSNVGFRYDITEGAGWISPVETKALSSYSAVFNVSANETPNERTGKITFSDSTGVLTTDVTITQPPQEVILGIWFIGNAFLSPVFHGDGVRGASDWGDGMVTPYDSTATHRYSSSEEHIATFTSYGTESVTIPNMDGVKHLDLTKFCKQR